MLNQHSRTRREMAMPAADRTSIGAADLVVFLKFYIYGSRVVECHAGVSCACKFTLVEFRASPCSVVTASTGGTRARCVRPARSLDRNPRPVLFVSPRCLIKTSRSTVFLRDAPSPQNVEVTHDAIIISSYETRVQGRTR